jgi:hypothetical protein
MLSLYFIFVIACLIGLGLGAVIDYFYGPSTNIDA